ncbi:MAG TPA: tRNA (N(6)-L-threonylcarbamoyladenosine(37)-C(2))-methylthiotransferase MtaB [Candidatus Gastranaerophilales bacterium]|nr:tRNA (N(6)-L-threonylcarbamoyladenosine(37)-C(2))-methylthiotransferase MtaB [Candidatus Gastranaerophilales bacterium]
MKKVALQTLGCRANQLESSIIIDKFLKLGWEVVNFNSFADIYIINTCTVTGKSDNSSLSFVRKAKKINPAAKIIIAGCYPQVAAEEIAKIQDIDLVIGNAEKLNLPELLEKHDVFNENSGKIYVSDIMKEEKFRDETVLSASGRVRANIKIQDGCNYRCSYCIIPYARGKSRSKELYGTIEQIKQITDKGFKEIVLSGIHLGQWGLDLNPQKTLLTLLEEIEKISELKRFRLSSLDPMELNEEMITFLANSEKFCRHLHISLQSGNNEVLKRMNRRYTVEYYSELINSLVEKIPFINIGSDIIVGFPGETDANFENTYENLKKLSIGYIHIFPHSKRKNTPAAIMRDQVDEKVKKYRAARLKALAAEKSLEFREKLVGNEFEIIVENTRDKNTGLLKGMTDNFISTLIAGDNELKNQLVRVKITSTDEKTTFGQSNSSLY